jgi:DNA polymerase-1
MKAERLDALARDGVSFDLETHLIQPGLPAPPIVCASVAPVAPGMSGAVDVASAAERWFDMILRDPRVTLIGAYIAFDVLCMARRAELRGIDLMPAILAMYDPERTAALGRVDGRVIDVQVWEQLHAVAKGLLGKDPWTRKELEGRYSLQEVVRQVLGREDAKANDRFRLSYALLEKIPIDQWPVEAKTYPIDDAVNTLEAALAQAGHLPSCAPHVWPSGGPGSEVRCARCGQSPGGDAYCRARERRLNGHEIARQTYVSLCGALGGAWGFKIDQRAVDALQAKYDTEHVGQEQPFIDAGIIRSQGAKAGSVDEGKLKRLTAAAYGAKDPCVSCVGIGKVPSPATNGRTKINCGECDGTGLALPPQVPRTPSGEVGIGRDVLTESGDEFLRSFAEYDEGKKIPNTYIPFFRSARPPVAGHTEGCPSQRTSGRKGACTCPGPYYETPLNLRFNPVLETGRTSYDGVIQLMPREGGVRECIVARDGYLFSSEDYKAGELITHAQSCIWIVGASRLAEALNRGLDAHLAGAASIVGISYEEAVKRKKAGDKQIANIRQAFKPCNFGFPGRMGAGKLVLQQRKGGPDTTAPDGTTYKGLRFCILMGAAQRCGEVKVTEWKHRPYPPTCLKCLECATQLREQWLKQWPENGAYFDYIKQIDQSGQPVVQHVSKRLRGFLQGQVDKKTGEPLNSGNAIANGYFQGLLADAAKNALMAITRECYDRTHVVRSFTRHASRWEGGPSPLLGSRPILFAHDETVCEHPEPVAAEAATRDSEIMEETLRIACPDMDPAVEALPTLMRRLYKGAEPVYDASGRLIPWEPKRKAAA